MTSAPLIRTKLHRPSVPLNAVDRGRLIDLMENACTAPLTLVSAPAGYGKSVLVAQWAERCDTPVAWLSLDESAGTRSTSRPSRRTLANNAGLWFQVCGPVLESVFWAATFE
jgi:ATP/maltotriose-dependent transcriptional regulator MalT